jgi:hypothetical protein
LSSLDAAAAALENSMRCFRNDLGLGPSALDILTGVEIGLGSSNASKFIASKFYRDSCNGYESQRAECLEEAVEIMKTRMRSGIKIDNRIAYLRTLFLDCVRAKGYSSGGSSGTSSGKAFGKSFGSGWDDAF